MSESDPGMHPHPANFEDSPVRCVLVFSLGLTLVLVTVGWYWYGMMFARSVLLGSVLVNGSFLLLTTDARRLTRRIGAAGDLQNTVIRAETVRFYMHFFARLCVLGLVLFGLASRVQIHVVGLTVGLATVMCGVIIFGLSRGRFWSSNKV